MNKNNRMIVISTTSDSQKILKKIANELLTKGASVCTHIYKIDNSAYIWENKVVNKIEYKLDIKTLQSFQKDTFTIIKKNHNYEIFEFSISKINSINDTYNAWFNKQLK